MPARIFPGTGALFGKRYVKTGAFRPPKAGELFLSGAVPEVYKTVVDMDVSAPRHIMREASEEETRCTACGQRLPYSPRP